LFRVIYVYLFNAKATSKFSLFLVFFTVNFILVFKQKKINWKELSGHGKFLVFFFVVVVGKKRKKRRKDFSQNSQNR